MLFVGSRNLVLMNLNISCDYLHGQSLVIILDPEIKKYFGFRGVKNMPRASRKSVGCVLELDGSVLIFAM